MMPNCHVMLVDDEPDFRDAAGILLQMEGFQVSYAGAGDEALELLSSGLKPDLLLLDQRMPGLTGTETAEQLRRRGLDLPVVLVSAIKDVHDLAETHRFDAAIAKPFSPEDLTRLIVTVLRRRGVSCAQV